MRYLANLQCFAVLAAFFTSSSAALGDSDIDFVYELCMHGMATQPSVPKTESEAFCSCASNEVQKKITQGQRLSIRDAKNRMRLGQSLPPDIFQRSGLKTLVEKSQDHCIKSLWPEPQRISDKDHKKYSAMANKSVDEFNDMLDARCGKFPKSDRRTKCLADASREWIATKGKQYSEIPDSYITGNDLANTFIEKTR